MQRTAPGPHKPLVVATLAILRVSEESMFTDIVWRVNHDVAGQGIRHGTINWDVSLPDGSSLADDENLSLLTQFRALVWTLLHDPREGSAIAAGTLNNLELGIASVASWMVAEGIASFSEIDSEMSWRYAEYYLANHEVADLGKKKTRPRTVSSASASTRFPILAYIYRQRQALRLLGIEAPREAPYDGRSVDDVVRNELDLHRKGKLAPIPDDVAIPVLSSATRLLGVPANDVMLLQDLCMHAFEEAPGDSEGTWCRRDKYRAAIEELAKFQFSRIDGEATSWREPLKAVRRSLRDGRQSLLVGNQLLRRQIITIQSAAIVCIQASTGMRAHEMCGLDAGSDESQALPACIESEISSDGLMEVFYAKSVEAKQSKARTRWVIGARSAGSDYLPPPVRAFQILWKLYRRWRRLGGTTKLLVTFRAAKGLPREKTSVGRMTVVAMTELQKDFLREHCDLSGASEASRVEFVEQHRLRGHRWRTTFALFLFRVNSGLLPAISRHFQHMSMAMTERGYIGNDVALIDTLDSVRVMESARFMLEFAEGRSVTAGSMAKHVERFREELREQKVEATLAAAEAFVIEHDLRIFFLPYGHCFLRLQPEASRCHELGSSTHWSQRGPNVAFRSPSVCVGCQLFVADSRHLPVWRDREGSYRQALKVSQKDPALRVIKARHAQAATMVAILTKETGVKDRK